MSTARVPIAVLHSSLCERAKPLHVFKPAASKKKDTLPPLTQPFGIAMSGTRASMDATLLPMVCIYVVCRPCAEDSPGYLPSNSKLLWKRIEDFDRKMPETSATPTVSACFDSENPCPCPLRAGVVAPHFLYTHAVSMSLVAPGRMHTHCGRSAICTFVMLA